MYNNLKELITATRSYRGYDHSCLISRETLADFVDHARLSAASMNIQPLKYYLIYETYYSKKGQKNLSQYYLDWSLWKCAMTKTTSFRVK